MVMFLNVVGLSGLTYKSLVDERCGMSTLEAAVTWSKEVFLPYGPAGLFGLAFIESTFFPVPPDVLLIPLVLASPESALFLAGVTTLGSVAGAIVGYFLGKKGGRPVMEWMVSERNLERVEDYYDRYGVLAIGIAGFSPIPYKVFTVTSGAFDMDLPAFTIVSTLSRGARFYAEAIVLMLWGDQVVGFLQNYFGPLSLVVAVAIAAAYFVWKEWL